MVRKQGQKNQNFFYVHRFVWECLNSVIPDDKPIDHNVCDGLILQKIRKILRKMVVSIYSIIKKNLSYQVTMKNLIINDLEKIPMKQNIGKKTRKVYDFG